MKEYSLFKKCRNFFGRKNDFTAILLLGIIVALAAISFSRAEETVKSGMILLLWALVLASAVAFEAIMIFAKKFFAEEELFPKSKKRAYAIALFAAVSLIASWMIASFYTALITVFSSPDVLTSAAECFKCIFSIVTLLRSVIFIPPAVLMSALLLFPSQTVLCFAFSKRWIIAGSVFLLFFAFKIQFSNVGAFNWFIQPNNTDPASNPLFAFIRSIRSDEWLVNTPHLSSSEFAGYGAINDILRGTENGSLAANGLHLTFAALSNPLKFGYFLFGFEYGLSFFWCAMVILIIMLSMEFSYIISGGSRRVAVLGIGLIAFSPFNLWWSFSIHLLAMLAILVCTHYCFIFKEFWKKCLCMLGVAISGACFITQLYPAWQVPMVYLMAGLFIWIIVKNFDVLKTFRIKEWGAASVAIIFMASIVLAYLIGIEDYSKAVMGTVYPGERFETGGNAMDKAFAFIRVLQFPVFDIASGTNNPESATYFSLYPLPTLFAVYIVIRQIIEKIKDRTNNLDWFNIIVLIPTIFLTVFCSLGFPEWLAKITLMSYSPGTRAIDVVVLADVILLIHNLGNAKKYRLPVIAVSLAAVAMIANSLFYTEAQTPDYLRKEYVIVIAIFAMLFAFACFAKISTPLRNKLITMVCVVTIFSGLLVTPINHGTGALTGKPASEKIQDISSEDPDAKWIGYGSHVAGQFVVANGGPCITSVNYIPNLELWHKLDPDNNYEEVYNRFAHISLFFTEGETTFSLLGADHMKVELSYGDLSKAEIKYIFAFGEINENSDILDFNLLYSEDGSYIYEVIYK